MKEQKMFSSEKNIWIFMVIRLILKALQMKTFFSN